MLTLPVVQSFPAPADDAGQIVEVAFKGNRRGYYRSDDPEISLRDYVIVDAERGEDLGRVITIGGHAARKCGSCGPGPENPTERILRRADPSEVQRLMVLRVDEDRVRRKARELVETHRLVMKVTETEWQWDRNKLTLYFTAERRVDFRELVRDLARTFRTRIELKQIGVRDEAALLGGVGRCGRELCCSTWLREIKPISLQLAKDQGLSLNPAQISGTCGRLMCCLTYEHDTYLQARKRFPREGKTVRTAHGAEKVIGIDVWRDLVTLLDESKQRRVVGLLDLRAEIDALVAQEEAAIETAIVPVEGEATDEALVSGPEGAAAARRKRRKRTRARSGEAPPPSDN